MSDISQLAKDYADRYKNSNGIVDFYRFLGIEKSATDDEIAHAMMAKASAVEKSAGENFLKMTMLTIAQKHLGTPHARIRYDRKLIPFWRRLFNRADTKAKRTMLTATPFVWLAALILCGRDDVFCTSYYCSFPLRFSEAHFTTVVFLILSIALPFASFTRVMNWIDESDR